MPRLMSVAFTEDAVRNRTKTVTRRKGWWEDKNGRRLVKVGDTLKLVRKSMGRKPGEPIVIVAEVEVVDIRREPLDYAIYAYGTDEMRREGFPGLDPREFVQKYFVDAQGMNPREFITRIQWRYLDTCNAVGFWGARNTRFECILPPGHDKNHESDDVIWFGDHTPPCACGRCPLTPSPEASSGASQEGAQP